MAEVRKKQTQGGLEGPAIWSDPEPPADYTYKPVGSEALLAFLKTEKAEVQQARKTPTAPKKR